MNLTVSKISQPQAPVPIAPPVTKVIQSQVQTKPIAASQVVSVQVATKSFPQGQSTVTVAPKTSESVVNSIVKQEPPILEKAVSTLAAILTPRPAPVAPKMVKESNMASVSSGSKTEISKSSVDASKSSIISTPPVEKESPIGLPSLVKANMTLVAASGTQKTEPAWLVNYRTRCGEGGGTVKLWGVGKYGSVDLATAAKAALTREGCVKVGVGSEEYKGQDVYCCPGAQSGQGSSQKSPQIIGKHIFSGNIPVETGGSDVEVQIEPPGVLPPGTLPPPVLGPTTVASRTSLAFGRYLVLGGAGAAVGGVGAYVMKKKALVPALVGLGLGLVAAFFMFRPIPHVTPGPASGSDFIIPRGGLIEQGTSGGGVRLPESSEVPTGGFQYGV